MRVVAVTFLLPHQTQPVSISLAELQSQLSLATSSTTFASPALWVDWEEHAHMLSATIALLAVLNLDTFAHADCTRSSNLIEFAATFAFLERQAYELRLMRILAYETGADIAGTSPLVIEVAVLVVVHVVEFEVEKG